MENAETKENNAQNDQNAENQQENNTSSDQEPKSIKIVVVNGDQTYDVKDISLTDTLSMNDAQYQELLKRIDKLGENDVISLTSDQYTELLSHIDALNSTVQENAEGVVVVPDDWYTSIADLASQQCFYLALIFGLILAIVFFMGVKSRV